MPPSILYSYAPVGTVTTIVPVAKAQVGSMVVLAVAAAGAVGCTLMIAAPDAGEVHPDASVTVNV